jgi:hypothetical protein
METIKRVGNIAFEYSDVNERYEIVEYYQNDYYGKLEEYILGGYKQNGRFLQAPGHSIEISLFHREELKYTLAGFVSGSDGMYDLKTVCDRPFRLIGENFLAFGQVCKFAFETLNNSSDE